MTINNKRFPHGFTLIEMVVVLGIIAVLAGGVIALMGNFGNGAKIQRAETDILGIETAIKQYEITAKNLPSTEQGIAALVTKPSANTTPQPKRWTPILDEEPLDPWNNKYIYENNSGKIILYSKGPDGLDKTEDDISSED